MDKEAAFDKLRSIGQPHIFRFYDTLPNEKQQQLLKQVSELNIPLFRMQKQQLLKDQGQNPYFLEPFEDFVRVGNPSFADKGRKLIAEGKVGCLIVAGGMGTRLRFDGPKGIFPVSLIRKKSLFELFAHKILAASKQANRDLMVAIMTSPLNHEETVKFFEEHHYFGLKKEQVDFFSQKMLPMLDDEGNLFLDEPGHMAFGPDGNGSSLEHFLKSGIWKKWVDKKIRYLNYVLIDNPLADPFDAELVGFHQEEGVDVVVKCTERLNIKEKVGLLVKKEDLVKVIEYSEFPESEWKALNEMKLKHLCANISLFSFTLDFIKRYSNQEIPLHLAHKAVDTVSEDGKIIPPTKPNAWKFEKFIFDVLPIAWSVKALLYPRELCFAPLKNEKGDDSIKTVQMALQNRDRQVFAAISGKEPSHRPFELSQDFYYPTSELLDKWKGRNLPDSDYIE